LQPTMTPSRRSRTTRHAHPSSTNSGAPCLV
jgi:hypothetical protein